MFIYIYIYECEEASGQLQGAAPSWFGEVAEAERKPETERKRERGWPGFKGVGFTVSGFG